MKSIRTVRRCTASLFLALALVSTASGCGSGSSSDAANGGPQKVKFGYIADYSGSVALAVAQKQGLWKKAGVTPELRAFTNGPLQVTALGTGNLDFGYLGPGALWLPASGRASIVSVNMLGLADRVIARPGSGIEKPADLKGKKVAVAEGTSGDMILDLALSEAGLKPDDVTKVAMDASTVVTAFSSGQVDAAATWYPLIDTRKKKVPDLKEISETQDLGVARVLRVGRPHRGGVSPPHLTESSWSRRAARSRCAEPRVVPSGWPCAPPRTRRPARTGSRWTSGWPTGRVWSPRRWRSTSADLRATRPAPPPQAGGVGRTARPSTTRYPTQVNV
ncbi:ABC transporter substrate-binding protein [Streptomyces sp. LN549]|uniref:ABC transporter substrate-binding protein n=1 Tax=Streptomyces sp. LN549 TaxID=3112979 RepID=UPI003722B94D